MIRLTQQKTRRWLLLIGLLLLTSSSMVRAAEHFPNATITSSPLTNCMAVDAEIHEAEANTFLTWTGTASSAVLKLDINNAKPGHSIYLNGTKIGIIPDWTIGAGYCTNTNILTSFSIPDIALVRNGVNTIRIANDADANDSYSVARGTLEVTGNLVGASYVDFSYTSTYPAYTSFQRAVVQLPSNYDGTPRPLVIGVHGYGRENDLRWQPIFAYGAEANQRGWLLASPEMHGENPNSGGGRSVGARAAQRDLVDTVNYVKSHYAVDTSRVYIVGFSMGGQTAMLTAAKYPEIFAGVVEYSGIASLNDWYNETEDWRRTDIELECSGTPSSQPFEYARRAPKNVALGLKYMPLGIAHGNADTKVLPHHAQDVYNAVNATKPTRVELHWFNGGHDSDPSPWNAAWAFGFLNQFTLPSYAAPLAIRTDETKAFRWLTVTQYGGPHWSAADVQFSSGAQQITGVITEELGADFSFDVAGLGLPASGSYVLEKQNLNTSNRTVEILNAINGRVTAYFNANPYRIRLSAGNSTPTPTPVWTATPTPTATPTRTPTPTTGAINGAVFVDQNRNTTHEPSEPGVPNVNVELHAGTLTVATATTDAQGEFRFAQLAPAFYNVIVNPPMTIALLNGNSQGAVLTAGSSAQLDFAAALRRFDYFPLMRKKR